MPVVRIDALCNCDSCGKPFGIEIERSTELVNYQDLDSLVTEHIVGGVPGYRLGIRGKETIDRFPLDYWITLQGGLILCDICSKKADDNIPEGTEATPELVREVLGLETP